MATVKVTEGELHGGVIRVKNIQDAPTQSVSMPNRHLSIIDSGIEVEVEPGYCLCFGAVESLSKQGIVITNAPGRVTKGKVILHVLNSGRNIVALSHGDEVARCWVEKDHEVVWK